MIKAIILLSLSLLTGLEKKQELSTSQNDFNDSNLNTCTCNVNVTNDPSPKNNIVEFISAFNNHDLGAWNTWYYDNAPSIEVDSVNCSTPNLKIVDNVDAFIAEFNKNNSELWGTVSGNYKCTVFGK